ncbi:MAG: hypothetical protein RL757_189, partial [Bacteroidota bacterium]
MLRAIFIRKGSIGEKTTLINDPNQDLLDTQRAILNFGEIAIVCCTQAESSWTLLTDSRLIVASENNIVALDYENITLVSLMP